MGTREAVLTSTNNLCLEQKHEKYQNFLSENFHFWVVKFSVYLNRHVSVMFTRNFTLNSHAAPNYKYMIGPHIGPLPHM